MPKSFSPKRIFILNGHPAKTSLSKSITETYAASALSAGHDVRVLHLHDMIFNVDFGASTYARQKPLEPDLQTFQSNIEWAEHIVMSTPMWWGGLPAKLKGLLDRSLLPGWSFDTRTTKMGLPTPLLTGRTARIVLTSDTPNYLFGLVYRKALLHQLKGQIFRFVGIKPVKITHLSPAGKADASVVEPWLKGIAQLGAKGD